MIQRLSLIFVVCLASVSTGFGQTTPMGDYKMVVSVTAYDYAQNYVTADIRIDINLPAGRELVYIPLPFAKDFDALFIVEPTSDDNLVLFGHLGPTPRYSVLQINQSESSSKLTFSFEHVHVPLEDSALSDSNKALTLRLAGAHKELKAVLGDYSRPHLKELLIIASNIQNSEPQPSSFNDSTYSFDFTTDYETKDVTVFLAREQNQALFYLILGLFGVLLGYFTAPNVVSTRKRAISSLIGAIVTLIVIGVVLFTVISSAQRLTDTTTIVTVGTAVGLLIGLLITSIEFLFVKSKSTP